MKTKDSLPVSQINWSLIKACDQMKKLLVLLLTLVCMAGLIGCAKNSVCRIKITIPAGSREPFVYSDEEICPKGDKITIYSGEGLGDTEIILKTVNDLLTPGYVATYLTPGMPVEFDTEKGVWLKVGVSMRNPTDEDMTVYIEVKGVEVRVA